MRRATVGSRTAIALLSAMVVWPAAGAWAAGGEITLLAGHEAGDYGDETDTERQSASVRFTYGDKSRFRLDLDMVRVNSDLGVANTPFGLVPTRGPGTGKGPGGGTGSGGQGSGSQGSGGQGSSPGSGGSTGETGTVDSVPSDDWSTGLGDLRLTFSRRLVGGGAKLFRLDVQAGAKIPTADEAEGLGTGEADYRLGMAAQYRFWSVTGFAGIGWNSLGDPDWIELQDVMDLYVGVESQPLAEKIVVSGWLEGNEEVVEGTGTASALGFGISSLGKRRWLVQLRAGLGGSAEDFSALVGVSFGVSAPNVGTRRVG